jgi:Glycosyl hydrolases family 16
MKLSASALAATLLGSSAIPAFAGTATGTLTVQVAAPITQSGPDFIGRTEASVNSANTTVAVLVPSGIEPGDLMVVFVSSFNSTPTAPSGWTSLGSVTNSSSDVGAAFSLAYAAGDPSYFTFSNVNWPKAILRVYRGVTAVDGQQFADSTRAGTSLAIPALPATTVADDEYVGFFVADNATSAISGSSDLGDQTADKTQWASFDGDKITSAFGSVPPAATATAAPTEDWVGFGVTLGDKPQPALLPFGNVAPPAGQSWHLTLDDEFNQDSAINTAMWNGSGGPSASGIEWPMCAPGADGDQLGWSGNATCTPFYGNTSTLTAPYLTIQAGTGLVVQDLNNYQASSLFDQNQDWVGLQNYGNFSQVYGYFEVRAKMPHDNSGEGDGLHTDIWITINSRKTIGNSDEVDFAENDLGSGTTNSVNCSINEVNGSGEFTEKIPAVSAGDLSAAFHTYGLYWRNTGSGFGTVQCYFDGVPQGSPFTLRDTSSRDWGSGAYLLPGWMQEIPPGRAFLGGAAADATTSNNDPLIVQYARVWQSN